MKSHSPIFFVFAGSNGSGKSTLRSLIIDKIGLDINIDPDELLEESIQKTQRKIEFQLLKK